MRRGICFLSAANRIEPYNTSSELLPGKGYEVFGWSGSAHNLLGKNNTFFQKNAYEKTTEVRKAFSINSLLSKIRVSVD
jgi:hypothetical protein